MFDVLNDLRKCLCCVERSCVSPHIRKFCSKAFTAKKRSSLLLRFMENLTTSCDLVVVSRFHIRHFQHSSLNWNYTATLRSVSYTHLRAHETRHDLVCRLL